MHECLLFFYCENGHVHKQVWTGGKLLLDLKEDSNNPKVIAVLKRGVVLALPSSSAHVTAWLTSFSTLVGSPTSSDVGSLLAGLK